MEFQTFPTASLGASSSVRATSCDTHLHLAGAAFIPLSRSPLFLSSVLLSGEEKNVAQEDLRPGVGTDPRGLGGRDWSRLDVVQGQRPTHRRAAFLSRTVGGTFHSCHVASLCALSPARVALKCKYLRNKSTQRDSVIRVRWKKTTFLWFFFDWIFISFYYFVSFGDLWVSFPSTVIQFENPSRTVKVLCAATWRNAGYSQLCLNVSFSRLCPPCFVISCDFSPPPPF